MINNYSSRRPQSFVYQNKEVVEDTITDNSNAFIFGPCVYNGTMQYDSSNINIFNPDDLNENWQILFAGTPDPASYTAVTKGDKIVGFIANTNEAGTLDYVILNTNAWEAASNYEINSSEQQICVWNLVGNIEFFQASDGGSLGTGGTPSLSAITNGLITVTGLDQASVTTQTFYAEFTMQRQFNSSGDLIEIASTSDILSKLGPICEANPLGFAASLALSNAGKTIFADVVSSSSTIDASAYGAVLSKIENIDMVQFLAPVFGQSLMYGSGSTNQVQTIVDSVRQLALAHVEAMSNETEKKWRRCYFGCPYMSGVSSLTTTAAIQSAIVQQAVASNSDRLILVWTDNARYLTDSGTSVLNNDYVAAMVAGLRSSKLPQQGLSRESVSGISSIPKMYTLWNNQSLDDIAEQGVFIITQDYKDSDIYIRHQLTTDTNGGILYWEDSVGVNVDEISYAARDIVNPYIGKRNATVDTLNEINNKWYAALLERTNSNIADPQIGPQIVQIVDGSVRTFVHSTLKDRIVLTATLVIPLPINTIVVYINAVTSIE